MYYFVEPACGGDGDGPEVSKLWSALPGGAVGPVGGGGSATCLYQRHIYFEEIWVQNEIYILVGTLLGWNMKPALSYNFVIH